MSIGRWQETSTADGRKVGALALPQQDREQLTRVVATVNSVRKLALPGVVPIADLVGHSGRAWLISGAPVGPSVAELETRLTPGTAATVLSDTGQTLIRLHQAGLAHGALDASTVVVSPAGVALLSEVGVAAAAAGRQPTAAEDAAAWADLARRIGGSDQTLQVVAAAAAAGLETGLRVLAAHASALPGFGDRTALAGLPKQPEPIAVPLDIPPPESTTLLPGAATEAAMQAAPQQPAAQQTAPRQAVPQQPAVSQPAVPQEHLATQMARRTTEPPVPQPTPVERSGDGVLRFGQGPVATPATPSWTPPPAAYRPPKKSVFKRVSGLIGSLFSVLLVLGIVYVLLLRFLPELGIPNPMGLFSSTQITGVTVQKVAVTTCNTQADVVGTVVTNGEPGTFAYEWVDSDGHRSGRLDQSVRKGEGSVQVHYYWGFSGKGSHKGTATLNILSPVQLTANAEVTYSCK
ncbi:MAG: hypothetical protein HOU81_07235 [Hamadaea sp.]|uniref:hypothetical protein n=1 Tax=Hamadaea sp. TaxID=2024425 RepID=UPI001857573A|nr:hypothetical protein [Hamadaea sp.]NUR70597.1 hypothetical protein [Hamadaea sp.]NUT19274.1 hypothetical protein [Hamadaea sp.]